MALEAAKIIADKGINNVIVKMGAKGCLLYQYQTDKSICYPAISVKAVNTVGAGDCPAGALAFYLHNNIDDLEGAICFAQAAAGMKVSRSGGQDATPGLDEVQAMLNQLMR